MMLTVIVAAPILEEILFRGIIQGSLVRKYGPWRGVLVASAIFGVVHGIPQQVVNAFFVGAVLGFVYYCSRSLIVVMVIHAINNAFSYFFVDRGRRADEVYVGNDRRPAESI